MGIVKKETLVQLFSCEFCQISNNTFFTEHLRMTASVSRSEAWFPQIHGLKLMLKGLTNQLNEDESAGDNQKLIASFLTFEEED